MIKHEGYIVVSPAKPSDSLKHWGIGNPFKEAEVVRDVKGQFSKLGSSLSNQINVFQYKLANLLNIYDTALEDTSISKLPDGTTEETHTIILHDGTQIDVIKNKAFNGRVTKQRVEATAGDGTKRNLPNFEEVAKVFAKSAKKADKPFNSKAKLDTSQVETKSSASKAELRKIKIRRLKDKIFEGQEGSLKKSADRYVKEQKNKR